MQPERFHFCHFLNTEKCIPPIQNIECLMESERSFVTVQRIDGVEIPPWPSPCTHKERSQMTEHQANFQKMSFLIFILCSGLVTWYFFIIVCQDLIIVWLPSLKVSCQVILLSYNCQVFLFLFLATVFHLSVLE